MKLLLPHRSGKYAKAIMAAFIFAGLVHTILLTSALADEVVPEPSTYRGAPYRGPVPATLSGVKVVDTDAAYKLWQSKQVYFIDVLPRAPKPKNLPKDTIWNEKARHSIPGALWLPNIGYEKLADVTAEYMRKGLNEASKGNKAAPLLFFCLEECWMSWNAAKRALEFGYTDIYWFPDGTDGWSFSDYPLEIVKPFLDEAN